MAEHEIRFQLPSSIEAKAKDVQFKIYADGGLLGTLKISKGSLDWRDRGDKYTHVIHWDKFVNFAKKEGKKMPKK